MNTAIIFSIKKLTSMIFFILFERIKAQQLICEVDQKLRVKLRTFCNKHIQTLAHFPSNVGKKKISINISHINI